MPSLLALLLLAAAPAADGGTADERGQLCALGGHLACDYEARCSTDPHVHLAGAYDACRARFERDNCSAADGGLAPLEPEAARSTAECLRQLYPARGCARELVAITRACSVEQHALPLADAGTSLVDATAPEHPPPPTPPPPDTPHPFFFPLQGAASLQGELDGQGTTFGGNFYLGWAGGRAILDDAFADKEGPFFGVGLAGVAANTDVEGCGRAVRCARRLWAGPGLRLGWAQWNRRKLYDRMEKQPGSPAGRIVWPDNYFFLQVTPFFGAERLPSAPLAPAETALLHGVRVDLGVNSIELSRSVFYVIGKMLQSASGAHSDAAAIGLFLLPLALLNHLEFNVEWSNPALSPGGWRAGVSMGAGF